MGFVSGILEHMNANVGVDIVDIARFKDFKDNQSHPFILKSYSPEEIEYCYSFKDPIPHLAGFLALKEAASKALSVQAFPWIEIEVRHDKEGRPEAWHKGSKLPLSVSISHSNTSAVAIALPLRLL